MNNTQMALCKVRSYLYSPFFIYLKAKNNVDENEQYSIQLFNWKYYIVYYHNDSHPCSQKIKVLQTDRF